jgi:ketosteroid isomerase-like protein
MSQENVEIMRAGFAAYNRRHLDGILENWAPDAVLDRSNSRGLDAGVYRGHDEIRAFMERSSRHGTRFGSRSSMAQSRSRTAS